MGASPSPGAPQPGEAPAARPAGLGFVVPLLVMIVIMGLNYPIVKVGLPYASPFWLAFFRAIVGAAIVWAIVLIGRVAPPLTSERRTRAMLLGLPTTALYFGLSFWALTIVPPGAASVLASTAPLWVLVIAMALGSRPSAIKVGALVLGFAGIVVVAGAHTSLGGSLLWPELALVASAAAWGASTLAMKRWFRPEEFPEVNAWQLLTGSAVLLVVAWAFSSPSTIQWTPPLVGAIAWLGIIGTGVAFTLWFTLLARGRASTVTGYLFLVPVVSIIVSVLAFGEALTALEIGGIGLILVATVLLNRSDHTGPAHHALPAH